MGCQWKPGATLIKGQVENEEEMDGIEPELKKMELREVRRKPERPRRWTVSRWWECGHR